MRGWQAIKHISLQIVVSLQKTNRTIIIKSYLCQPKKTGKGIFPAEFY
jgi:hypothetical protein